MSKDLKSIKEAFQATDGDEAVRGTERICWNCAYVWRDLRHRNGGECRRNPPTTHYDQETAQAVTYWPRVSFRDWCGQWAERDANNVNGPLRPLKSVAECESVE